MPIRLPSLACLAVLLCATAAGGDVHAQASRTLAPDHWAVLAVRRLEARGLLPDYLPAQNSVPLAAIRDALDHAATRAPERAPELAAQIGAWGERLAEEFGAAAAPQGLLTVETGYTRRGGAGLSAPAASRLAPASVRDEPFVGAALSLSPIPAVALTAEPRATPDGLALPSWEAAAEWKRLSLSVGRQPVSYGFGEWGGVVLSGAVALDRVQLQTTRPLRLPGILRHLGPTSVHTVVGRFEEGSPHTEDPRFWSVRVAARPHERLTLAANRAALFGGRGAPNATGPADVFWLFLGTYNPGGSGYENQIASGEIRYRPPTERLLPMVAYLEWGTDDAAGGLDEAPGLVAGVLLPSLPGLPAVTAGLERSYFGVRCCRTMSWYDHKRLYYGAGDRPLGHPLGGNGTEWLAHARADLRDARLRLEGRVFARTREATNLYGERHAGSSRGFRGRVALRLGAHADLHTSVAHEAGEGWTESLADAGVRVFF